MVPAASPRTLSRRRLLGAVSGAASGAAFFALVPGRPRAQTGVRRAYAITADGARLYALVRGEDASAPVMIWLHGGPGGAERPLFRFYNADLERRFVVVYWDQRGAGRSFDPKADPRRLTIARHLADLDLVVDRMRRDFHRRRVILVGHSWGAALGLMYAAAHPDKVSAFVGVGQPVNERARQESQQAFVQDQARRRSDSEALARLARLGPPPWSAEGELAVQRLVELYGGYVHRGQGAEASVAARILLRGLVLPWELGPLFDGNAVSLKAMNAELLALDLSRSTPRVGVPVIFMLGRHDRQVDSRIAAAYFDRLEAPAKRLMWFEDSAHNPPFEEPGRFNAALPRLLEEIGGLDPAA